MNTAFAKTVDEAVKAAEEKGYLLWWKLSPQISNKSDSWGIKLSLQNAAEVKAAYKDKMESIMKKKPERFLREFSSSRCSQAAKKLLWGWLTTPFLGPCWFSGLAEDLCENPRDVRFAIAPVNQSEAREMITGIKTYPLLAEIREMKPSDIDVFVDVVLRVSRLVCDFSEIKEFEINPLLVFEEGRGVLAVIWGSCWRGIDSGFFSLFLS